MTGSLPFDAALEKTVQQFGIGPYDSSEEDEHGEDSNKRETKGKSLPDGGGSTIENPEVMLSYPTTPTNFVSVRREDHWGSLVHVASYGGKTEYEQWLDEKAEELRGSSRGVNLYPYGPTPEYQALRDSILGSSIVPGDADRPPRGRKPAEKTINDPVQSVSHSELPADSNNPAARSDYYDRMRQGLERAPDPKGSSLWADEDSGAYASESLPTPAKNEVERDNDLQPTGNAWSGRTVEDMSNEAGFPSTDYSENVDFDRSDLDGGGRIMASGDDEPVFMCDRCGKASDWCECEEGPLKKGGPSARPYGPQYDASGSVFMCGRCGKASDWCECEEGPLQMKKASSRTATNIALVQELTDAFIKKCGKKDLTRRHVMAFLKEAGKSQYFASDIIRCLKLSHKVYVKDVLDEFPVVKTASGPPSIASTRDKLVDLEILHMAEVGTARELRRCAAALSDVVAVTERLAGNPMMDYDDYAPAHGHAEDRSAHEAYKDYLEDWDGNTDVGEKPVSFEEFLEGKH